MQSVVTNQKTFQFLGGNLALDFCNTVHSVGHEDPEDDLETWADLLSWAKQAGILKQYGSIQGSPAHLARLKDLRSSLYAVFASLAAGRKPGPESLAHFNAHLHASLIHARMEEIHGRYTLTSQSKDATDRLHFEVIRAALDLLSNGPLNRVRECSGQTCTWLFLDMSRNGSRRWCEMKSCGNREKIRRFRGQLNR
jgi:predicted RNA-binding Zn ribbon-like protein